MNSLSEIEHAIRSVVYETLRIDRSASDFIAERLREVLLRIDQVRNITGLSSATIYREINAGRFPKAIPIAKGAVAWRLTDLEKWMDGLAETALTKALGVTDKFGEPLFPQGAGTDGGKGPKLAAHNADSAV